MTGVYEELYRRLREERVFGFWERLKVISLTSKIFAIPVRRAIKACENWKLANPDRSWGRLRDLISSGAMNYSDGELIEARFEYWAWGRLQEPVEVRVDPGMSGSDRTISITLRNVVDDDGNSRLEGVTEDGRIIEVRFLDGTTGIVREPVNLNLAQNRFYCGLASIESELIEEVKTCQTCAYHYADASGQVCNAFHNEFNIEICGDWKKK